MLGLNAGIDFKVVKTLLAFLALSVGGVAYAQTDAGPTAVAPVVAVPAVQTRFSPVAPASSTIVLLNHPQRSLYVAGGRNLFHTRFIMRAGPFVPPPRSPYAPPPRPPFEPPGGGEGCGGGGEGGGGGGGI